MSNDDNPIQWWMIAGVLLLVLVVFCLGFIAGRQ